MTNSNLLLLVAKDRFHARTHTHTHARTYKNTQIHTHKYTHTIGYMVAIDAASFFLLKHLSDTER